ncbi:hypothetical protein [Nitrosovibrio tenuis]|uniref:Uncharacterized protein n=1 Tax=Nitrosovibrio tenuis TaxID=1233 RepID=A0A1H7MET7_9PROT|nr:hypothetical protein [Nitrosovibrio tenuis]SEL09428.1 hypothetical protein SAMN05216387_10541 [Nitrosovibrio tenuis]
MSIFNVRLKAVDDECERAAKIELDKLFEDARNGGTNFRPPSPQAAEAIWLKLIARKEHEFIQEIERLLKPKSAGKSAVKPPVPGKEDISTIEEAVDELFADDRYLERMQDFYREAARKAALYASSFDVQAKRLDLIDATYRTGIVSALRRARHNIVAELERYNRPDTLEDTSFLSQWRRYSTLSPWRSIGTIVLLSLTSYLIAFIIASDTFRGLLERLGWSSGTGL